VEIDMNVVYFQVWRVNVGRVPVYLLDTNLPENEQHFRDLTAGFMAATAPRASCRKCCWASAGCGCCARSACSPRSFHMNEGHAAFLTLELMREKMAAGQNYADATGADQGAMHFTTHTPVEAGHDRFSPGPDGLRAAALPCAAAQLPFPPDMMGLGR
jgi:starch phosphorylase